VIQLIDYLVKYIRSNKLKQTQKLKILAKTKCYIKDIQSRHFSFSFCIKTLFLQNFGHYRWKNKSSSKSRLSRYLQQVWIMSLNALCLENILCMMAGRNLYCQGWSKVSGEKLIDLELILYGDKTPRILGISQVSTGHTRVGI
jgi:hypothetical protein